MSVVLVPGVLALLPEYAGLTDPVAELRAACLAAVSWLGADVEVLADPQGARVARSLLDHPLVEERAKRASVPEERAERALVPEERAERALVPEERAERASRRARRARNQGAAQQPDLLVVGNGSACRSEKAPGHLDDRSFDFDRELESFLRGQGPLPSVDLGVELQAATAGFELLAGRLTLAEPIVDYAGDPFGVQYWVMRWELP